MRLCLNLARIDKWSLLAAVRFLLASIVAVDHLETYAAVGWAATIAFGTFEAVMGFLLISGYSIGTSYAKQPEGFLWRRILRLYPIYFAAMAIVYLQIILLKEPKPTFVTRVINSLFLNQFLTNISFVGPAWSLSLEFWLYCLAPFLMKLSRSWLRVMVYASFFSYVIYTILRTLAHLPYYSGTAFGINLLLLSFVWVAGLGLSRRDIPHKAAIRDIAILFCGHASLAFAIQFGFRMKHHEIGKFFSNDMTACLVQSLTLLAIYLLFRKFVIPDRPSLHRSSFLRTLGDISYPLYLVHFPVYIILSHYGMKSPLLLYLIAVLVAALIYWSVDFYSKARHKNIGVN